MYETKQIFTKTQAVSVLEQISQNKQANILAEVDANHKLFKLSCDELETRLKRYVPNIAAVVDDAVAA